MVKKKKSKTKVKARRAIKRTPKRVAGSSPLSKAHEKTLKAVNAALEKSDKLCEKVAAAESAFEAATGKIEKAVSAATRKKTAAAKRAAVSAKNTAKKAKSALAAAKTKASAAEKTLKAAVKLAEVERKMEEAKDKAVSAFLAKWQKAYDKKTAKRARKSVVRKKALNR